MERRWCRPTVVFPFAFTTNVPDDRTKARRRRSPNVSLIGSKASGTMELCASDGDRPASSCVSLCIDQFPRVSVGSLPTAQAWHSLAPVLLLQTHTENEWMGHSPFLSAFLRSTINSIIPPVTQTTVSAQIAIKERRHVIFGERRATLTCSLGGNADRLLVSGFTRFRTYLAISASTHAHPLPPNADVGAVVPLLIGLLPGEVQNIDRPLPTTEM